MTTPEQLDHRQFFKGKYGVKHKSGGLTPSQVAELDPAWLVWAYENWAPPRRGGEQAIRARCARPGGMMWAAGVAPRRLSEPWFGSDSANCSPCLRHATATERTSRCRTAIASRHHGSHAFTPVTMRRFEPEQVEHLRSMRYDPA